MYAAIQTKIKKIREVAKELPSIMWVAIAPPQKELKSKTPNEKVVGIKKRIVEISKPTPIIICQFESPNIVNISVTCSAPKILPNALKRNIIESIITRIQLMFFLAFFLII